ncbi:hypothetical protein FNV43_RR05393 [Rhamnella rubrinervis]|uniref:Uncharacterized protein n=1 Tax=Rhamnella rubrinervis TaxID=2594499 RepID=A0A8K0HM30_9ROSA|nr:hypothetical protein FNV43_RR05393 [Rhamnella rubrinervis]
MFDPVGSSELDIRSAWAERALNQSARLSTNSEQNNSIDTLHAQEEPQPSTAKSFRAIGYWPSQQKKQGTNTYQQQPVPPTEPPYQADMGKLKVPPPTKEQLAEKDRKRKEKKSARSPGNRIRLKGPTQRQTTQSPFHRT